MKREPMSKIKATDAKFGEFYEWEGSRYRCLHERSDTGSFMFAKNNASYKWLGDAAELTHLPDCTGWDWQPSKPQVDTSLEASCNRLERWFNDEGVAEYEFGDVLTSDDAQRIIEAARKWNEANNGWQVTTREDADQYSYDGVQWSPIETCPIYNTPPLMFRRRIK